MSAQIVYLATLDATGKVDAECRPMGDAPMDAYSLVLAVMVCATINMFKEQGFSDKEATNIILKRITREVRNPSASATYAAQRAQ